MRNRQLALLVLGLVSVLALTLAPVQAQEEMAPVACDSTLITLVFLAEYHYGYKPNIGMGDTVVEFDHGQFTPWFETMMGMTEEGGAMDEEMMATEEAMMEEGGMMEGMTELKPGNVEGEDTYCTDLRADVEKFLYDAVSQQLMSMSEGS